MYPDDQLAQLSAAAQTVDRVINGLVRPCHNGVFWGDRMLVLDRSADFLKEPAFRAAMADCDSSTGANLYASPDGIAWRFNTLIWAARSCLTLPGDYVECGVYKGDMTWMVTQNVDLKGAGKKFYLYDTFDGFCPRYSSEADFPSSEFLKFADQVYSQPDIEDYVRNRFAAKAEVIVIKGVVPDILETTAPMTIAFLHLDMNSPAAETGALDLLFNRIPVGGIIVFDDYGWSDYHKQKEAADRFMAQRSQVIMELPTGQGLMVKR